MIVVNQQRLIFIFAGLWDCDCSATCTLFQREAETLHSSTQTAANFPIWAFTGKHQTSNWSAVVIIQNYDGDGDNKVERRPPKPKLYQSSKFGRALMGWHVTDETLIKVYSEHLLPAFGNSHFMKGTERNHLIGMRALYKWFSEMPQATQSRPYATSQGNLSKNRLYASDNKQTKRQTIRVWKKCDGLQWQVWKESQGRKR